MAKCYTTGRVVGGRLTVDESAALASQLGELRDGPVDITVSRFRRNRSTQQNAWYWGVALACIADATGYTRDECHDLMKALHLPREMAVCDGNGEEVGRYVLGGSSAKLTTDQFVEYTERVRRWAAETLGVAMPDPGAAVAA